MPALTEAIAPSARNNVRELDEHINNDQTLTDDVRLSISRTWASEMNVAELRNRLRKLRIPVGKKKPKKQDFINVLIEHRVPLQGGPIQYKVNSPLNSPDDDDKKGDGVILVPDSKSGDARMTKLEESVQAILAHMQSRETIPPAQGSLAGLSGSKRTTRDPAFSPPTKSRVVVQKVSEHKSPSSGNSFSVSFGLHVSAETERLFEKGLYVSLTSLRSVHVVPEKTYVELSEGYSIPLERRATARKKITTMAEWNVLFGRAKQGYVHYNPKMFRRLEQHQIWMNEADHLRRFAISMLLSYDEELRKRNQGVDANFDHDISLMGMYLLGSPPTNKRSTQRNAQPKRRRPRQCNIWEKGEECPYADCKFRHACRHCSSAEHKSRECPKRSLN